MNVFYEKLAAKGNKDKVSHGDEINIKVDYALAHDGSMPKIIESLENDNSLVNYGSIMHVTVDHFLPAPNIKARESFQHIKEFCKDNNINLYHQGEGILHQVIADKFGDELEDKVIVGVDGHMCTGAGMGGITFSITPQEMVNVLKTGRYTLKVPEYISIQIKGSIEDYEITGKDLALYIIKTIGIKTIKDKAVLINGKELKTITNSQRMTIGNMLNEVGARTVHFDDLMTDEEKVYNIDISKINPLAIVPDTRDIRSIKELEKTFITAAYIGGCTNGRIDDMKVVANILDNNKVHEDVTLIVAPASRDVANEMDELGYSKTIRNSGGIIINPGCGACSGIHQGVISRDDIMVTTTPRNTPGRMGDERGKIYIVSPKTAAISAIHGSVGCI